MGYEPRHLPCGIEAAVFRAHHDVPRALRTLNFIQAPRTLHLNAVCDVRSATGVWWWEPGELYDFIRDPNISQSTRFTWRFWNNDNHSSKILLIYKKGINLENCNNNLS